MLHRNAHRAWIGGVCAGLAESMGLPVLLVRVAAFLLLFVSFGIELLVYVALWLLLPNGKGGLE
jgi:phage shock protein C